MIRVRDYEYTDRYYFEKMVKQYYTENEIQPPSSQDILETIGFFSGFPQAGKIYIIQDDDTPVGYSIILHQWKNRYAKIVYHIDELYIQKNYRKNNLEINFVEHLIKHDEIKAITVKIDKLTRSSRKIFRLIKFHRRLEPVFVKMIND